MKRYRSQRIYITTEFASTTLVHDYTAGKAIEVRYDPEDFSRSYLVKESADLFPMIAGLFFAATGVFLFRNSRRLAGL